MWRIGEGSSGDDEHTWLAAAQRHRPPTGTVPEYNLFPPKLSGAVGRKNMMIKK
jgi:hypothetical protein